MTATVPPKAEFEWRFQSSRLPDRGTALSFWACAEVVAHLGEGKKAWLYEIFYRWQLTDNISTTAALSLGTNAAQTAEASNVGGVIQTQFRF